MTRVRMAVAYDGAEFHGFARNPGVVTVAGALEQALSAVLRHEVAITCSGRTDRGVHALEQVVSFDADADYFEPVALQRAVNRILRPVVVVRDVRASEPTFCARLSCVGRSYRYHVLNDVVADPLLRNLVWHVQEPLDIRAMNSACDQILGTHDFSAFCKRNKSRPLETMIKTVEVAHWSSHGSSFRFDIKSRSFAHQMVRSLVGLMVEVGIGKRRAVEMGEVLRARDRKFAAPPAPPHGLVFMKAHY